ncbi:PDZ domain-containing protein [Tabrizicola sp.]|uniref:PDZ domain-containing protein n=1 Tax=Tabrizicola sp. TaxID=2005166 RepID=UPI002635E0F0|nr:PDZ domain-containing protein [Tabrizicola sp.]MDM7931465.1 PDZ domain-containing protein [Tabrizicola sp.]
MAIADQLVRNGQVRRGQLGVIIQDVTRDMARALGLDAPGGALIAQVMPGGAAEVADLRPREVIVALDGAAIPDGVALRYQIGLRPPDQEISLDILREGKRMSVAVVPRAAEQTPTNQRLGQDEAEQPPCLQGLFLKEDQHGVMVSGVAPASGAARAGRMVGDRIIAVGTTPTNKINQFRDAVAAASIDDPVLIEVERQGSALFLTLP